MKCSICHSEAKKFGGANIMGKHPAIYHRCTNCGFIFVPSPSWLAESYESAINRTDIGPVFRADTQSRATKAVIELFFRQSRRYVDYGAGYGLFVRKMRDIGYDFVAFDRYCENLFAPDFAVKALDGQRFDIATAFEVVEHLESPLEIFREILEHADALLFSTELVPEPAPLPGEWWYYGLDHGQHIALFTRSSLECVARAVGKHLATDGERLHLLSNRKISSRLFRWATRDKTAKLIDLLRGRPSLLPTDFERVRKEHLSALKIPSL